ncbi:hypothetical protein J6590_095519 [Homalodisca vitripennis]|nr:hypothetical protein J6590_095519 [Homalodisca vitripennis]
MATELQHPETKTILRMAKSMAGVQKIIKCLLQVEWLVHRSRSLASEPTQLFSPYNLQTRIHPAILYSHTKIYIAIVSPPSSYQNPPSYSLPKFSTPEYT